MGFIDLNRYFVPIAKDEEPNLDIGRLWGRKIGGWLDWPEMRQLWRVVLLAEASSGKTAEFRNQTDRLRTEGLPAFFVRIEELADWGFEAALEPGIADKFQQWQKGAEESWFFLDAVDEARLNRKSFETALKRFARELGKSVKRARVFISCRVSDWQGRKDRDLIERLIPAWERPKAPENNEAVNPLLDPIFKKEGQTTIGLSEQSKQNPNELLVVQLGPLSAEQYRCLATAYGVNDVDRFVGAIDQYGLNAFTERPGDLLDLVEYWKSHNRFTTFSEVVDHSINRKLKEPDSFRPDNEVLSFQKAREGAERIAAVLTFGKSFTLKAPGADPDPTLASGAIDSALILEEWTDAERNVLLRRGIFAPSTYGRIRFHHRATQEYLTAQWLERILDSNCPRAEVSNLIFATRYGIDTIVPSLRPAAAWLALRHSDILEEIIHREPLVLLQHGDPGALSLKTRKRLLAAYAVKHAAAEIADDSIDHRALWMFAHPDLAEAIRDAWHINSRSNFRLDLLRLIREGAITACVDLARDVSLDHAERYVNRIVAIEALDACQDDRGLLAVRQEVMALPANLTARFASSFAKILFPRYLSVEQLFLLIDAVQPAKETSTEGFPYSIEELYNACPDRNSRREFVTRLGNLCFTRPFASDYIHVAGRHFELAKHVQPIAIQEVELLGKAEPLDYLIRLLMVVERAERTYRSDEKESSLSRLVRSNAKLQRALFWADVEELRANSKNDRQITYYWQVHPYGETLWQFETADLNWLYEDLSEFPTEEDQRIALSAILFILQRSGRLDTEIARLRELVRKNAALEEDMASYLRPRVESEESLKYKREREENRHARTRKDNEAKASWVDFQQQLQNQPDLICVPQYLHSWRPDANRLWNLTKWLQYRTKGQEKTAARQWRLLEEGFGRHVAEAYRDGMKILWRLTRPERLKRNKDGSRTIKHVAILAFSAIGLEAAENSGWAARLSDEEAKRAVLHGCFTDHDYPEWLENLLISHPAIAMPVLKRRIRQEWLSSSPFPTNALYHYARRVQLIRPPLQQVLFELIASAEPGDLSKLGTGLRIINKLDLDKGQIRRLMRVTRRRLSSHKATENTDIALRYLAMLLLLDPDSGIEDFEAWLGTLKDAKKQPHAESTFGFLFDRHYPVLPDTLARASIPTLEKLLRLAYSYVRPEHDLHHEDVFTPGTRDKAEDARNAILGALLDRSGADAFWALRRVADEPEYNLRADRFRGLAHGMAERDTELIAWASQEVTTFELRHTAPVKAGIDLLNVILTVLEDIQFQLDKCDASSRPLLQRARDEDEVQNWIVEQMNYRSRERYNAYREVQVAQGDKPDIIVSSTAAQCEVAIEVKHGGKGWTLRQLEHALVNQLGNRYLKPSTRRHGILVITHHGRRKWRDPDTKTTLTFNDLMLRLDRTAYSETENDGGPIEVKCVGINTSLSG